jgi:hypothetical protein
MFCSPYTNWNERKEQEKSNILAGNIFGDKKVSLTTFGYKSLLETLVLYPKKKHFKKVLAYLKEFEKKEILNDELINLIVQIGIDQKYPVLLGTNMKYFMQNGYHIPLPVFQKFLMFMENCKGFEEDAKRFVFLTAETEDLDFSYSLVRPIFLRLMKQKTGNEILKTFEQFRKNIHLNKKEE